VLEFFGRVKSRNTLTAKMKTSTPAVSNQKNAVAPTANSTIKTLNPTVRQQVQNLLKKKSNDPADTAESIEKTNTIREREKKIKKSHSILCCQKIGKSCQITY
jgi:hypothetical protein